MEEEIEKEDMKVQGGSYKMEYELWILISLIYLFAFYLIIKTAVTKGIDDAKSIRELKKEIKELKKQKSEERNKEESKHIINRKA